MAAIQVRIPEPAWADFKSLPQLYTSLNVKTLQDQQTSSRHDVEWLDMGPEVRFNVFRVSIETTTTLMTCIVMVQFTETWRYFLLNIYI